MQSAAMWTRSSSPALTAAGVTLSSEAGALPPPSVRTSSMTSCAGFSSSIFWVDNAPRARPSGGPRTSGHLTEALVAGKPSRRTCGKPPSNRLRDRAALRRVSPFRHKRTARPESQPGLFGLPHPKAAVAQPCQREHSARVPLSDQQRQLTSALVLSRTVQNS
jgi:hypothetical protein